MCIKTLKHIKRETRGSSPLLGHIPANSVVWALSLDVEGRAHALVGGGCVCCVCTHIYIILLAAERLLEAATFGRMPRHMTYLNGSNKGIRYQGFHLLGIHCPPPPIISAKRCFRLNTTDCASRRAKKDFGS